MTGLLVVVMFHHTTGQSFVDPATGSVTPNINLSTDYSLDFSDEFNDNTIDATKWNIDNSTKSRSARPKLSIDDWWWVTDNASEQNGNLVLDVDKHDYNTMYCGSVNSQGKYETTYGYFEARIKIAQANKGTHTAFWLQGQNQGHVDGSGQDGAEIDIFESAWLQDYTKSVVHIDGYGADHQANTKQYTTTNIHDGNFHTWGFLWEQDKLSIYYDGSLAVTYTDTKWIPQVDEFLWLSDGASFGIEGDYFTSQPNGYLTSAYVDYIRVWKKQSSGIGALNPDLQLYWEENGTSVTNGVLPYISLSSASNISTNTSDWVVTAGDPSSQELTTVSALSLTGYPKSGTGNAFRTSTLNGAGAYKQNNIEYSRRIGNSSGAQTIYLSMITSVFQVRAASSSFPIGFAELVNNDSDPSQVTKSWASMLLINNTGGTTNDKAGKYQFGLQKSGGTKTFATTKEYTANGNGTGDAALFVVIKLTTDGNSGNGNDQLELYSSTTFPADEPSTWDLSVMDGTDFNVNAVFIREKMDASGVGQDHFVDMGNIRVADSWEGLFASFYNGSWSLGEPSATVSGIVESDLTVSSALTTKNLIIKTGNKMTVSSSVSLDINGDLKTDGILEVLSGGSLLTYSGNSLGNVTYHRNSSFTDAEKRYSFIGSPVAGFDISDLGAGYHYSYNTADDSYSTFSGTMTPGVGYTSAGKQDLVFIGAPNTGNVDVTLETSGNQFNFVANPYTAAISRSKFVSANSQITGAIYLWDDGGSDKEQRSNSDFITVTNAGSTSGGSGGSGAGFNGYIGAAQGFIVQASGAGDVVFAEDMRSGGNNSDAGFFRRAEQISFKLNVSDGKRMDQVLLAFCDEGSREFDMGWDAEKFRLDDRLTLATLQEDGRLMAIQTLADLSQMTGFLEIPLHISNTNQNSLTFSLQESTLPDSHQVRLVDKQSGKFYDLLSGEVKLTMNMLHENRFALVITEKRLILSADNASSHMKTFIDQYDQFNVTIPGLTGKASMIVYDLGGKIEMVTTLYFNEGHARSDFITNDGIYLIKIGNGSASHEAKLIR